MRPLDMKLEAVREAVLVGTQGAKDLYQSSIAVNYDVKER